MSKVSESYEQMLAVGEIIVANDQFSEWLNRKNVPSRTTKNVMLRELGEFREKIREYYKCNDTSGSLLDSSTISAHVDNIMLKKMESGLEDYCKFAELVINEHEQTRLSVSKFFESMYIFVQDRITHLAIEAERIRYDD